MYEIDDETDDDTLCGKLLIAMPGIGDGRFSHAVILVCSHAPDHAMGLILNKPVPGLVLPELLDQLDVNSEIKLPPKPVLDGGPVGRDRGFVLHSSDFISEESTLEISDGVNLTATREVLHAIASEHAPREAVLALGYAGWGEGQLEEELSGNVWLVAEADRAIIYGHDFETKWAMALDSLGIDPSRLYTGAGRA